MSIIKGGGGYGRTKELRESLSVEELAERAITVPIKIMDLDTLEKLIELSKEFDKTFDQLVLLALQKLFTDVAIVRRLSMEKLRQGTVLIVALINYYKSKKLTYKIKIPIDDFNKIIELNQM